MELEWVAHHLLPVTEVSSQGLGAVNTPEHLALLDECWSGSQVHLEAGVPAHKDHPVASVCVCVPLSGLLVMDVCVIPIISSLQTLLLWTSSAKPLWLSERCSLQDLHLELELLSGGLRASWTAPGLARWLSKIVVSYCHCLGSIWIFLRFTFAPLFPGVSFSKYCQPG